MNNGTTFVQQSDVSKKQAARRDSAQAKNSPFQGSASEVPFEQREREAKRTKTAKKHTSSQ